MVVSGGKGLKRAAKKRVTADFYDFLTFPTPALAESENFAGGPFRSNVRAFLTKHALLPPPSALFPHLLTWQIVFRVGELTEGPDAPVVCLDVVEEDVARSRSVYCDQCRVFGELTRQYFSRFFFSMNRFGFIAFFRFLFGSRLLENMQTEKNESIPRNYRVLFAIWHLFYFYYLL